MIAYRYDPRYFEVGDNITPDLSKPPLLTDENKRVESMIFQIRPELRDIRSRALYTWQNLTRFESQKFYTRGQSNLRLHKI